MTAKSGKILLFTAFSPDLGGGSTNLRSIFPHLDREVVWAYTSTKPARYPGAVHVGEPLMGGSAARDLVANTALWSGLRTRRFRALIARLLSQRCDAYWVVGHYEGTLVARELLARGKRVHLTIQDDLADAVFSRSRRYRHLTWVARRKAYDTIARATSVDVTSDGMGRYYQRVVGRESFVMHPYVRAMPALPRVERSAGELKAGHIGIVYSVEQWLGFVEALVDAARKEGKRPRMTMIGLPPRLARHASAYPDVVEVTPMMEEPAAIERLAESEIVYAMYPFGEKEQIFRSTSLPTKLSSYVQARRPILAQTPAGSTLAELVNDFRIGRVVDSMDRRSLSDAILALAREGADEAAFERAREEAYGDRNVTRMNEALARLLD